MKEERRAAALLFHDNTSGFGPWEARDRIIVVPLAAYRPLAVEIGTNAAAPHLPQFGGLYAGRCQESIAAHLVGEDFLGCSVAESFSGAFVE